MTVDHERACCDDIVRLKAWADAYEDDAQRWRDTHNQANTESFARFGKRMDEIDAKLDRIEEKVTTFVNPILTALLTVGGAMVGSLITIVLVLWQALQHAGN